MPKGVEHLLTTTTAAAGEAAVRTARDISAVAAGTVAIAPAAGRAAVYPIPALTAWRAWAARAAAAAQRTVVAASTIAARVPRSGADRAAAAGAAATDAATSKNVLSPAEIPNRISAAAASTDGAAGPPADIVAIRPGDEHCVGATSTFPPARSQPRTRSAKTELEKPPGVPEKAGGTWFSLAGADGPCSQVFGGSAKFRNKVVARTVVATQLSRPISDAGHRGFIPGHTQSPRPTPNHERSRFGPVMLVRLDPGSERAKRPSTLATAARKLSGSVGRFALATGKSRRRTTIIVMFSTAISARSSRSTGSSRKGS